MSLVLIFGVDYRFVEASYIGPSLHCGILDLPLRMLVPCVLSLVMIGGVQMYLTRSFLGRAILAVSQDRRRAAIDGGEPDPDQARGASASRSRPARSPAPF